MNTSPNKSMLAVFLLLCVPLNSVLAQKAELRIITTGKNVFRCCITNDSDKAIEYSSEFLFNDNNIFYNLLTPSEAWEEGVLGADGDVIGDVFTETLQRRDSRVFLAREKSLYLRDCFPNDYLACHWRIGVITSGEIILGVDCGSIKTPLLEKRKGRNNSNLAAGVILNIDDTKDLSLLYRNFNFSNSAILDCFSEGNKLILSSLSIGYSNEVAIASLITTNVVVAPKSAWHWRIPWQDFWNQIPESDRARLEEAGEVDLRWKCGDMVSDPLPLWVGPIEDVTNNPYSRRSQP